MHTRTTNPDLDNTRRLLITTTAAPRTLRIKTSVKAGADGLTMNHNAVRIRTGVKAGSDGLATNHNAVRVAAKRR